ncbi:MAG: carbohydrate-binding protein [Bryobacteraceae bacterium]
MSRTRISKIAMGFAQTYLMWPVLAIVVPALMMGQRVTVVQTNADKSALLATEAPATFDNQAPQALNILVNDGVQYQSMDGFGASFTDSSAWLVWNKLTGEQRRSLMAELFTPEGINLSFLRQPMGASDLALSNYTYDDVPAGETDPALQHFSIDHDKAYILPVLREALALNPNITVMALPWSPPAWMKAGDSTDGGSLDQQYLPVLAKYFAKFIKAYGDNGVPVTRIAVQNEPLNNNNSYPTEFLSDAEEAQFIGGYLGPAIEGLTGPRVEILGYEHNWDVQWYGEWLLRNPESARYVAGMSFHCYAGDPTTASTVMNDFFPDKGLWFTECSGTVGSSFAGDLAWNSDILAIGSVRSGAKSVSLWNLALDQNNGPTNGQGCQTCRGVVTVDWSTAPATITRNVEYYVLGQAAKFVVPGARRIDSNTFGTGSIEDVAFKNPDGSIVVLVLNSAATPSPFSISWNGRRFSYTLPAGAVATFKWNTGQRGNGVGVTPSSKIVAQGSATHFMIDGDSGNGHSWTGDRFAQDRLKVSGLPGGTDYDVTRNSETGSTELWLKTSTATPTGTYSLIVAYSDEAANSSTVQLTVGTRSTPFTGTAPSVPGTTVQAENWDAGTEGTAYDNPDLFTQPDSSPYRAGENVALELASDVGGGYDVSFIGAGEWLNYTVNVTQSGLFSIQSRLASQYGGTYYHVDADGRNATGQMYFPNTGGWQSWTTASSPTFYLSQGVHVLRYEFDSNNANGGVGNINWFALAPAGLGTSHPFGGTAARVPGIIQAENFDTGGKNVAYYNSATTKASVYRTSDTVGIEVTQDTSGGYDVGNTNPGDWLNYTVDIAAARSYTLQVRVASGVPGGTFHLACDGQRVTPSMTVPWTMGWETFQTIDVPGVELPKGVHALQLVMDNPGVYPAIANFNWFSLN